MDNSTNTVCNWMKFLLPEWLILHLWTLKLTASIFDSFQGSCKLENRVQKEQFYDMEVKSISIWPFSERPSRKTIYDAIVMNEKWNGFCTYLVYHDYSVDPFLKSPECITCIYLEMKFDLISIHSHSYMLICTNKVIHSHLEPCWRSSLPLSKTAGSLCFFRG